MEPRSPVLLKSRDTVVGHRSNTTSWVPEEDTPVHRVKEDLGSKRQDLDQEWWSFCVGKPSRWNRPTKKWTSTFESVFADGGISIRVQKPPLKTSTTTTTTTKTNEDEGRDEDGDGDEDVSRTRDTIAGLEDCEEFAVDKNGLEAREEFAVGGNGESFAGLEACGKFAAEDGNGESFAGLEACEEEFAAEYKNGESFARCERREVPEANTRVSSQADDDADELGGRNVRVRLLSPSLSLSTPVMEKMEAAAASLEVPCPWNKRETTARSGEQSEGFVVREQGELLHPSTTRVVDPSMRTVDPAREGVAFRQWNRQTTKEARDKQDGSGLGGDDDERARNGLSSLDDGGGDYEIVKEMSSPNSGIPTNLRTLNLRSKRTFARTFARKLPKVPQEDFNEDMEHDHPFPSSIIRALSPTSSFLDKQEPLQPSVASGDDILSTFQQFCDSGASSCEEIRNGSFRRSPRSVLLQDSDEISQCTSDSSGSSGTTGKKRLHKQQQQQQQKQQQQKQTSSFFHLYNEDDESSDLESPLQCKFRHELVQPPFAAFTYSVGTAMLATSPSSAASTSADEAEFADLAEFAGPVQELGFFHEAKLREPWLVNDGGVLDDVEDLEYLSSPDLKAKDTTTMMALVPIVLPLCSPELRNGLPVFIQSLPIEEMPGGADRKVKHESLKTKLEWRKAKFEIPRTKHDSPKAKDDRLKPKPESRRTRPTVLKPKPESPKTKPESPKTKLESPKTKPESPKTKPDSPKTELESHKTEHDKHKVKHDSERGPKFEKKWVPFVTSSLHCNKPAQVCNSVAKGSPTQNNLVSKKSTNQERIPSTRKAPKRCVKFAPDLVNFAPDFVREIPDSATTPAALDRKQQRANPTATKKQKSQPPPAVNNISVAAPVRSKPKSRAWEVDEEVDDDDDGPSIMNSRRRSRWRNRDAEESKSSVGSTGRRRERVGPSSPSSSSSSSCAERLLSWPRRLAHKANCRNADSDDDDGSVGGVVVAGDRSFGMSSRRDAELVRRILKGSQQKYSSLTGDDILNEDFR